MTQLSLEAYYSVDLTTSQAAVLEVSRIVESGTGRNPSGRRAATWRIA
jgi:hypothetical protein